MSHVREPNAGMQRSKSAEAAEFTETAIPDPTEAAAVAAPPRMKPVTRSERQPAEAAPTETDSKPKTSESKERNISWQPEWTIEARTPNRSRPPSPSAAVPHPTTVVIRRPAPRLVADPSP